MPTIKLLLLTVFSLSTFFAHAEPQKSAGEKAIEAANKTIVNINTEELKEILKENPKTELIDVRTQDEVDFIGATIDADENVIIPRGWIEFDITTHVKTKDTPIVVYCGTGLRSPLVAKTLMDLGYTNVKNHTEGFNHWKEQKLPLKYIDKAPESMLYSLPIKVKDNVYSAIGATAPGTYANSGHNNNLSFIVTDEGVLVFNAGDNYLLAQALHSEIKKITDKPVKYVVLENAQGHAMLGTSYWQKQGAIVIAHVDALKEAKAHGDQIIERMQSGRRDKSQYTTLAYPDKTFEDKMVIELGGETIELLHLGPAHSPGDISLWLPKKKLMISGDLTFRQRLLPVMEHTDTQGWINTWDAFEALKPEIVIPGHGSPTSDIGELTRYTKDYLVYMRKQVSEILDNDGSEQDAYEIDQSAYSHLDTFSILALQNAGRIFRSMEFE